MNWLDSTSISGLLTQAQKSIDKVLDIPSEDDAKTRRKTEEEQKIGASKAVSPEEQAKKTSDKQSSGSWLSGADSFWGSFSQTVGSNAKKSNVRTNQDNHEETKPQKKSKDVSQKESRLSSKQLYSKQSNKKLVGKKKSQETSNANESFIKENISEKGVDSLEGEETDGKEKKCKDNDANDLWSASEVYGGKKKSKVARENNINEKKLDKAKQSMRETKDEDVSCTQIVKTKVENVNMNSASLAGIQEQGAVRAKLDKADDCLEINEQHEKNNTIEMQNDDCKNEDVVEEMLGENLTKMDKTNMDLLVKGRSVELEHKEEVVVQSSQNFDVFLATPVAASTPQTKDQSEIQDYKDNECIHVTNEPLSNNSDSKRISMHVDLGEALEDVHQDSSSEVNNDTRIKNEKLAEEKKTRKGEEEIATSVVDSDKFSLKEENAQLLQIIDIRESKLVELSKENLKLQETNTVLRSQIDQLEEMHRSEDAELEDMKTEFTKRIGDSEAKLQVAAKERDLLKKQLEETQTCLNSDNEKQLKDFQTLSRQKDEQITQLMEEGENLSKKILQSNNNIKKLRKKEKELNNTNETLSTRLVAAEAEIERLTGILKDRDQHEKEQDGMIEELDMKYQDDDNNSNSVTFL